MTKEEIFKEYNITDETQLSDLLNLLEKVEIVSDKEKRNIESISVKTLPSVVYNQEDNIKKRMYGIATDSKKGTTALFEKRIVLLGAIISKILKTQNNNIEETPISEIMNENGVLKLSSKITDGECYLSFESGSMNYHYDYTRGGSKYTSYDYTFRDTITLRIEHTDYDTGETSVQNLVIATREDLNNYVNIELLTSSLPIKDLKISGKVEGNLSPKETGKYNLGNTETNPYFWKDLFLTGKICFNDKKAIRDDGNSLEIGEDYYHVEIKKTEISNDGISVYSQEQTEPIFKATNKEVKVGENNGYLDKFMAYADRIELTSNEEMSLRNKTTKMNLGQTINDFDFLVEKADGTDVLKLDRLKQILLAYDKEVLFKENFDKYKQEHANEYEVLNKKVADFLDVDEETMNQLSELINAINNNETGLGSLLLEISKKADKESVGSLENLNTTAKDNLVGAINEVNNKQNVLQPQEPKGTYDNLSALQTAYPNGASGVYVTTDNGYWNYWDGTEWKAGAVYQSSEDINQLKEEIVNNANINGIIRGNNLFDKYNVENGYFLLYSSGAKVSNSSFCYSKDYIEIDSTKTKLYLSKPSTHFCFYDEGKNFIEPSWNSNVTEIEIPSNAKYVRFSMPISQCEEYMAMYMNTYGLPYIAPYRNVNERTKLVVENMSNLIAVTYYTYFIEGNCDIIIKSGTYDVATYVGNIVQVYNSYVGMLIGKGNKYYFEPNTKLICNYTGSNENINKDFSVFTSYIGSGDFELINCNIEASRIRYCIHDECGSETTSNSYEHKYINCDLYLDNTNNPYFANYKFALGGGLGNSGIIILDKCIFKSKNVSVDVSYHGNYGTSDISTSGKSEIYVTNCYFEHGMQLALPNPETNKKKIIYTNNSSSNDLKTTGVESYWDIYKWNNEIRVS